MSTSTAAAPRAEEPATESELTSRRSGCSGTLLSGGCGCLAFMSGAALAIALFGAHLLSGWGARALEELLASGLNATVEVSGVDLSWSRRQTVRSVTIVGPDGRQAVQASAELPSLLDLFGQGSPRWDVSVDVLSLRSRVDDNGVDDLQRIMQVGDQVMLETLLRSMARWADGSSVRRGLRIQLSVKDWTVDDTASGRGLINVRDLEAEIRCQREYAALSVGSALVSWPGRVGPAAASGALRLAPVVAYTDGPGVQVQSLTLSSDGVPLDVARSLGLVRRTPPSVRDASQTPEAWLHGAALDCLMADLEAGATIDVAVGPDPAGQQTVGRFDVRGERLTLSLGVEWREGAMVPRSGSGSGASGLTVRVRGAPGGLAGLVEGALPDRFSAEELSEPLDWTLVSDSFAVPFEPRDLLNLRPALFAAMGEMQLDAFARVLAGAEARVRVQVPEESDLGLDLSHYLTSLAFDGERGSVLRSSWRDASSRNAVLELRMPPAGDRSGSAGSMNAWAADLPSAMLGGERPLPPELSAFLPERLSFVGVEGLALPRLGDWAPAGPSGPVQFSVRVGAGVDLGGAMRGSVLSLNRASVRARADEAVCEVLFGRLLPWFTAVRPQAGQEAVVEVEVDGYTVDLAASEFRETGKMTLAVGAMQARLQPGLAGSYFNVRETEWVEWGPEEVRMELDDDIVRYRKAQIPLGDDEEPVPLSGFLDRGDNVLSIKAVVPANVVVGAEDAGILPVQLTLTGPAESLDLAVDRDVIAPLIEAIRGDQ